MTRGLNPSSPAHPHQFALAAGRAEMRAAQRAGRTQPRAERSDALGNTPPNNLDRPAGPGEGRPRVSPLPPLQGGGVERAERPRASRGALSLGLESRSPSGSPRCRTIGRDRHQLRGSAGLRRRRQEGGTAGTARVCSLMLDRFLAETESVAD